MNASRFVGLLAIIFSSFAAILSPATTSTAAEGLPKVAFFQADVTPPLGSPLCDGLVPAASSVDDPLSARGAILWGEGKPIVLCAVDWVGIGNTAHDAWRAALAEGASTTPDRVAVHCLHQHDAPGQDDLAQSLLAQQGLGDREYNVLFAREALAKVKGAVHKACENPLPFDRAGVGHATVEQVASNRRILGSDGKVKFVRYSACADPVIRAEPEGLIDPLVRVVGFWNKDQPLGGMSYYATHPQSYYGRGKVSADFVGQARSRSEQSLGGKVPLVHFNGAGGNLAAGKYNDGSEANRAILAERLAAGILAAWKSAEAKAAQVQAKDIGWREVLVKLPARETLVAEQLTQTLADAQATERERIRAARDLAFKRRCDAGHETALGCLLLGKDRVVHLPGEIFVEYQLAAQKLYPSSEVCTAGYGDYGAGYIGTKIAYDQGGYETSYVSRTSPNVEEVLLKGLTELLGQW